MRHATLTASKVGVDAHVARCAAEALPLAVRDVLLRLRVAVVFRHAEVWKRPNRCISHETADKIERRCAMKQVNRWPAGVSGDRSKVIREGNV